MEVNKKYLIETMFAGQAIYQIPVYQRNYAWEQKNCEILLQDIFSLCDMKKENPEDKKIKHFLGMVLVVKDKKDLIIDGQQRYITTYLLLKAMYDLANDNALKNELEKLIFNTSGTDNKKPSRLKLKAYENIESDYKQFESLMINKQGLYKEDSNIIKNYTYFYTTLQENANTYTIQEILDAVKKLEIVYIELYEKDNDDPQLIFEKINSTGVELTLADLIRNHIFMHNENAEQLYKQYWLDLEDKLKSESLNDFFIRYCQYKFPSNKNQSGYYNAFKKMKETESLSTEALLQEMTKYSNYYHAFTNKEDKQYSKKIRSLLNVFIDLKQTTIFVFLFTVFEDFENEKITEDTVEEILKLFISFTMRRAILSKGTNVLRGLYKGLSSKFKNDSAQIDNSNYLQTAYAYIEYEMPTDKEIEQELPRLNLYKSKLCKLVLSYLENGLLQKEKVLIDDAITIEHIMPQTLNSAWKRELGEKFESVHKIYLDTIGNLTLTGYNSELGNEPFQDKKKKLIEKSKYITLNKDVLDKEVWGEAQIYKRAERLTKMFLKVFALPKGV